jgi:glucan phosphorylase
MSTKGIAASGAKAAQEDPSKLLKQYGCGPIQFMGTDGLYERHLHFDKVIDEKLIGPRERFEAVARSIRDVLSQRWVLTDKTYEQNNPKRVYYLSIGLRYEYGIFKQLIQDGWQYEQPDPWEVVRPHERVEIKLNCSFELHGGTLRAVPGKPSMLYGVPFDRPVVGYGGKTVNTLRLWAAVSPDYFDFQRFSSGDFVAALTETLAAESLTRVLYPDDLPIVCACRKLCLLRRW